MRRNHHSKRQNKRDAKFKKSLVTYVLMLIFFGFLFLRVHVPAFVFFIIAIPMTISIIHKYIDLQNHSEDYIDDADEEFYDDAYETQEEEWDEEPLELEDMKTLRKEWKDSDFV